MSLHKTNNREKRPKTRRSLWVWLLWGLLFLLLAVFLLGLWVWIQRFSLVETQLRDRLAAEGIESELSITELSKTEMKAANITLGDQGREFLKVEEIHIAYDWRELLDGKIKSFWIKNPVLDITVDRKGKPDLSFLTNGGGSGGQQVFPEDGVIIENALAHVSTPYGQIATNLDGQIMSERQYNLALNILPSSVLYGDVSADFEGPVKITQNGKSPEFELGLLATKWAYKELSGQNLRLEGKGEATPSDVGIVVSGAYKAEFDRFMGKAVGSEKGVLTWDGDLTIPRQDEGVLLADGNWALNVDHVAMPEAAKRQKLARRLMLFDSLEKAPITSDFAVPLANVVADLLSGGMVSGSGSVQKHKDTTHIYLDTPLVWENAKNAMRAKARQDLAFYDYQRAGDSLALNFDAVVKSSLPMNISNAYLEFRSTNGRNIKGANAFTGDVVIPQTWSGRTASGKALRLRPMTAKIDYNNTQNNAEKRYLNLTGKINYDGDIPGGYVTGLVTSGQVKLDLGDQTKVYFSPSGGGEITMKRYEIEAPWVAENVSLRLADQQYKPLYIRALGGGQLSTAVHDLETDLISTDGLKALHLTYDTADISAKISNTLQTWNIEGYNVLMTSDTVPSLGTVMKAETSNLTVNLKPDSAPEFTVTTPEADVETQIVQGEGLAVKVKGTPEHFKVDYADGFVKFKATDLPPVRMTGSVIFKDNIWQGKAVSFMEMARGMGKDTPIDVTYSLEDGRGSADVSIPEIFFRPSGMQPQMFIPALSGKVAEVVGRADVNIHLEFAEGEPMKSSGTAKLIDMNMGTLPGPLTGVNAELKFSSFFPLVSEGLQTVTIKSFDPGFPLPDGEMTFEAVPDGLKIHSARWPLGSGFVSLDPTDWIYTAEENRMQLRIEDVSLSEFLGDVTGENFSATGSVSGLMPVVISGISVLVENGRLEVKDGGIIKFQSPQTNAAAEKNEIAGYAFDALKEFHYKELEVIMNGPLDGSLIIRLLFEGANPDVLGGAVFRFNVKLEGELLNIARSFTLMSPDISKIKSLLDIQGPFAPSPPDE